MKKLAWLAILASHPVFGWTLLATTAQPSGGNPTVTGAISTLGANLLTASLGCPGGPPSSVVDSNGNVFTQVIGDEQFSGAYIYVAFGSITTNASTTLSVGQICGIVFRAWSGAAVSPVDTGCVSSGVNASPNLTLCYTGNFTPSQDNSLILATIGTGNGTLTSSISINQSFTGVTYMTSFYAAADAYLIQAAASSVRPLWSNGSTNLYGQGNIVSFIPAAPGTFRANPTVIMVGP
jgi:hypothetical protein